MAARILIAKPGLDGHDRGAKLIARALRDVGFEVIYTGLRQIPEAIAKAAVEEDVAVVGLSILSGAHVSLTRRVAEALRAHDARDIHLLVGGTIPRSDISRLLAAGAAAVFPTGSPLEQVIATFRDFTTSVGSTPPQTQ
jgi:methylmalonyl-CoA mutase C-terminal domain/subunit